MRLVPVAALVFLSACGAPSRKEGSLEVFVAGEEAATFDTLVLEVREGGSRVALKPEPAASFSGSFRFESAPAGTFTAKVYAREGGAVVLEAPSREVVVRAGETTGAWVHVNADPGEDDDGDLVRNGEDPCPQVANETPGDADGDGTAEACDNCPGVSNPSQLDTDSDLTGDSCDSIDPGGDPILYAPVGDLFASRCSLATCHSTLAPAEGLVLTAEAGYASTVNVASSQQPLLTLIEPLDPATSYLFLKTTGDDSISGTIQPPAPLAPLSPGELALIQAWIEDGALP